MPSRISEADVDLNMTGIPFSCLSRTTVKSVVRVLSADAGIDRHRLRRVEVRTAVAPPGPEMTTQRRLPSEVQR
jgi:hypothetical protein